MGGKVLDLEVIRIRNMAIENEKKERIEKMLRKGKSPEEIADFCDYPLEIVQEVQESMLAVK